MKRGCIFFFYHPEPSEGEAALFLPVMHPRAGLSSPLKYVNFPHLVSSAPCFQIQAEMSCSLPKCIIQSVVLVLLFKAILLHFLKP